MSFGNTECLQEESAQRPTDLRFEWTRRSKTGSDATRTCAASRPMSSGRSPPPPTDSLARHLRMSVPLTQFSAHPLALRRRRQAEPLRPLRHGNWLIKAAGHPRMRRQKPPSALLGGAATSPRDLSRSRTDKLILYGIGRRGRRRAMVAVAPRSLPPTDHPPPPKLCGDRDEGRRARAPVFADREARSANLDEAPAPYS